jgi:hypothetical protein
MHAPTIDPVDSGSRALRRRIAVIRNPRSLRNRRNAGVSKPLPAGSVLCEVEPHSAAELPGILRRLADEGVEDVVIDGGDGTLRDVMSALLSSWPAPLPRLALLSGGNANLAAVDVGSAGHGRQAAAALLTALATPGAGHSRWRSPMIARWPDGAHPPVACFFAGAAGFHRGWKLALGDVHRRGFTHGPAVAVTVISAMLQALLGGRDNPWRAGEPMMIAVDGRELPAGPRFVFLATTLHRLYGRLWPFFDHGDAALRWLDVSAQTPRLARSLPRLLSGRPNAWMRASGAYRSGGASRLRLKLAAPLVLDGEAYEAGPSRIVELSVGPALEFFRP